MRRELPHRSAAQPLERAEEADEPVLGRPPGGPLEAAPDDDGDGARGVDERVGGAIDEERLAKEKDRWIASWEKLIALGEEGPTG